MNDNVQKLKRLLSGFIALCLGSSDKLMWIQQPNAAAYSDSGQVFLPEPAGIEGEQELLLAIAMREVARIKHADAGQFASVQEDTAGYAAAIEDARVKQAISAEYLGAPDIFAAATPVMQQIAEEAIAEIDDMQLRKDLAVWFATNDALLGTQSSAQAAEAILKSLDGVVDPRKLGQAVGLSQAAPLLGDTLASVAMARRVHALLIEEQQDDPPESASGASESSESDAGSSGQDGDANAQASAGEQGSTGDAPDSDGNGSDAPADGQSGGKSQGSGNGNDGTPSKDAMSNALARLKGFDNAQSGQKGTQPVEAAGSADPELVKALAEAMQGEGAAEKIAAIDVGEQGGDDQADEDDALGDAFAASSGTRSEVQPVTSNVLDGVPARLVNVLLRAFHDKRPTKIKRCERSTDVDQANVWRLRTLGDTRVFRKKSPTTGVDVAVEVLLDQSLSMKRDLQTAASSALAFAQALQRISGVQTAIDLFPGHGAAVESLLKFRQNPAKVAGRLRSLTADGGTPMGQAIEAVLPGLLDRPVHKRVLFIITDGEPDNFAYARRVIRGAQQNGVDVIGIGIGMKGKRAIGILLPERSVAVSSARELPDALGNLFKTKLGDSLLAA